MTALILALQVALPLSLVAWLAFLPAGSLAGRGLQAAGTGAFLFALARVDAWRRRPLPRNSLKENFGADKRRRKSGPVGACWRALEPHPSCFLFSARHLPEEWLQFGWSKVVSRRIEAAPEPTSGLTVPAPASTQRLAFGGVAQLVRAAES